jgi:hypothetical protein
MAGRWRSIAQYVTRRSKYAYLGGHHSLALRLPFAQTWVRRTISTVGPQASPDPDPNPVNKTEDGSSKSKYDWKGTAFKMSESALTTLASITVLGLVGYSYTRYYKHLVLQKMENAFKPGDPVLERAGRGLSISREAQDATEPTEDSHHSDHWVLRPEQELIDKIVHGQTQQHYYLLIGEKGTGKSSMLIEAMRKNDAEGVAMFDAHSDLEIFRIRLGKALDFEFQEDSIHSLFSIRGPREATALLDVERAMDKLEKVALKRRAEVGRPIILIINSVHLLRDDEDGRDLLELIQQRAEAWAANNLCTIVLNSDDYWVYERLKNYASRLRVLRVKDLTKQAAITALRGYRLKFHRQDTDSSILESVYDKVGGRLSFLTRVAQAKDMLALASRINQDEKTWFLNKCWVLGVDMDDDVMDQQKYACAAMVLAKALVDREKSMKQIYDPEIGHILPSIPLHQARQIMTRGDFIQSYDHDNLFTIDADAMVRADSVPMMNAFREVCAMDGFDEHLQATLDRISDIESLGRTREVTIKDLWNGGRYKIVAKGARGVVDKELSIEAEIAKEKE